METSDSKLKEIRTSIVTGQRVLTTEEQVKVLDMLIEANALVQESMELARKALQTARHL